MINVAEVYSQCARALMRAQTWSGVDHSVRLPTIGDLLAEAKAGFGGASYDIAWRRPHGNDDVVGVTGVRRLVFWTQEPDISHAGRYEFEQQIGHPSRTTFPELLGQQMRSPRLCRGVPRRKVLG